jgi:serine protease Do
MRATFLSLGVASLLASAACDRKGTGAGGTSTSGTGRDGTVAQATPGQSQPASTGQSQPSSTGQSPTASAPPSDQQAGAKGTIPPTQTPAVPLPSFADLADRLEPAVVNVQVVKVDPSAPSPYEGTPWERFFRRPGAPPPAVQAAGSGFVISPDGFILTNNHVVENARSVKVTTNTGEEFPAKVRGRDPLTDLAVVKVEPKKQFAAATMGDSDAARVGDWVIAIGNPFGLEGTVTAGIISAKGRVIAGPYDDFLQTDAAINPGNSGGPLFGLRGEVVGINTAIIAQAQGVGFAIPINLAKELLPQLKEEGRIARGWLGVVVRPTPPEMVPAGTGAKGALVVAVDPDGPAAKAGVKAGDILVAIQGRPIDDSNRLPRLVASLKPGSTAELKILRDGQVKTLTVTVEKMPDPERLVARHR